MTDLHRTKNFLLTLAICFVVVSLYVLNLRTLVPPDEGRYAEMAREMFASGDWVTTRLNGIKYFEKPPLQTWMTALAFTAFGLGEWQTRLWTGICGMLGVGLTGYAGWRVFGPRIGIYSALVLGSSFYWTASSQINSLDMGLSGMMTVALCAFLLAQHDAANATERRNWMLVCWAGMALSVLSKGLIGIVLPLGILTVYTFVAKDWRIWQRFHPAPGVPVFFAIAAPWFVMVGFRNPEQPYFFFVHEHFNRFMLNGHKREAAWWVFLALLAIGSIPWIGMLLQSLVAGYKRRSGTFQPGLLLLIWVIFIIAFFTKSTSKLPGYILPVFPALALLIANYLVVCSRRQLVTNASLMFVLGLAMLGVGPTVGSYSKRISEVAAFDAYAPWILAAGFVAAIGAMIAVYYLHTARRACSIIVLAVAGFSATQLLLAGFEPIGQIRAGTGLVPAIQAEMRGDTRIYSVGIYEQSLTFYLKRTVTLVDYRDEFDFGLQQQPDLALNSLEDFARHWRTDSGRGTPALAILHSDLLPRLRKQGIALRIVAADERRTVISNQ